ncbi:MAG: hypothetical protein Q7U64_14810 [Desulfocapsaceae bacterium]|nr:hypothetical protein [Desulfocapsaceae bacterium]
MQCIASYEIESDLSVVTDAIRLKIQHPNGRFQVRIKNIVRQDYSSPFLISLQIIFDSPNLNEAKALAEDNLVECLNMLVLVTGAGVRLNRIKNIVDCTPTSGMRDCLVWDESVVHDDPIPFLNESIMSSIEHLLQFELSPAVKRALKWYRIGIYESIQEDQFQYFWFALEILAEHQKPPEKVTDKCPKCKSSLYCETCRTHPTHKPYAKQAIQALIQSVVKTFDDEIFMDLDKTRNALMHGAIFNEIEHKLSKTSEEIIDLLGKILFKAFVNQFPLELFGEKVLMGNPTTYIHRTMTAIASVRTIVPNGEDGELDPDKIGIKISKVADAPPQSGQPSVILMTPDQHKQLGVLAHEQGDHSALCKRVYERVDIDNGKVIAFILSTDMTKIRDAIKHGETGAWQDFFRDIVNTNVLEYEKEETEQPVLQGNSK